MTAHPEVGTAASEDAVVVDPINEEIRVFLVRRQLKHHELARILNISQPQVTARLNGRVDWKLSELRAVADLLGVRLGELVDAHLTVSA